MSQVERINDWLYRVDAPGGPYTVEASERDRWMVSPTLDSELARRANLRTRDDKETWSEESMRGPFESVDAAVGWLDSGGYR